MALTRADHKRIALTVAGEIKKVLAGHNAERLMAKHQGRKAPKPPPAPEPGDSEDLEAALSASEPPADEAVEEMPLHRPPMPPPKGKGFPPRHG